MRPTAISTLLVVLACSLALGSLLSQAVAARGGVVPVAGWPTGAVLLALAALLLVLGLPIKRYLDESAERREHPSLAPRRHQLDLPTAYRIVMLARSAAYTGAGLAGVFSGQAVFLLSAGGGDLVRAVLPTAFAALSALVLGVLGVVVERWGTLPPDDGADAAGERSGGAGA